MGTADDIEEVMRAQFIGPVGVMARETDCRIGRVGRIVVGLDVEHSVFEALIGEPGKSGERHRFAEPLAVTARVDGDDVDLAEMGIGVAMDLGPAESDEFVTFVKQAEPVGVVPRFLHGGLDRRSGEATLLRVPVERPVVDRDEIVEIVRSECPGDETAVVIGQGTAQLPEVSVPAKTE